ncbi:DUF3592 domain-containing protein [Phytopseudomonas dryadis]|uniref:DUF3592 domain-containing protein n=1 Tax=Phytopseudomonas dryadis TaxID=2487520 RepID=A0A4Q9QWE2_9GAMM|nr:MULTISPECIES: hypothetical protein [Pseudomonas]TBU88321.1 hypothetical protein DNK44_18835 [Pseudomonas dryadis]TBV01776.1 hypothetical protein DNK34_20195 [Pseudomonas dryadis]TBV14396.1 hypothetical protein DNK41_20135 [Pseudomonas sp. FRB 230]
MYYPREEQRDFLFTLSSFAIWMIPVFAFIAFLAQSGATVAIIKMWPATQEGVVTSVQGVPANDSVERYEYSFSMPDGMRFTGAAEQYRLPDTPRYSVGQTIEIMHSPVLPSVHMPREIYEHSRMNFLVFTTCIAAIFGLLAVSIHALVRQCSHAREDLHY